PPPTAWAKMGARGWVACEELGRQAAVLRSGTAPRGDPGNDNPNVWIERAARCPRVPDVLVLAAQLELVDAGDIGGSLEPEGNLQAIVDDHRERITRVLRWLDAALAESARRREPPPKEARFYRAYALLTLGRVAEARTALARVVAGGEVERWRSDRMAAVIALVAGDLDGALRLSHRAWMNAPGEDRPITRYIRTLVLDRGGAIAAARAELLDLRTDAAHQFARKATESLLPVHERLYLRALDHQAADEASTALRLWDAYLARPEVAEPERALARRHRDELRATPPPVAP
ncbi:MAG TPA: hypothetical protein VFG69_02000, partial [Nannocystaceae bacterium]|nr:hypothetical protein [Nannocystaceae bacterium]